MEVDQASPSSAHQRSIDGFDEYGFAIFALGQQPDTERCHVYKSCSYSQEQLIGWKKLLADWDDSTTSGSSRLNTFIKRGVPKEFRPTLWKNLLEIETLRLCNKFNYKKELDDVRVQLVELGISEFGGAEGAAILSEVEGNQFRVKYGQISLDALRHILLDLERTYPTHVMFMNRTSDGKEGKATLFRVLATYARYNKCVEYCQGMSAIAGMFLMYMDEEDAFWCLVSILERQKYLAGYFNEEMARLKIHSVVFEKLLYQRFPDIQRHLEKVGINSLMFITPWFLCVFTNIICWDVVLAVWDLLLLEGYKTMFRVGISIMDSYHHDLLKIPDISSMLPKLLHLPVDIINYIRIMPKIYGTNVEDWEVNCLMSVIEQEQRLFPDTPPSRINQSSNTLTRSTAKKRKPSEDDKLVFQFKGRERQKNKRIKGDKMDSPYLGNAKPTPSFFTRFTRMFQRQHSKEPGTPINRKSIRRKSSSRRKSNATPQITPGKHRNSCKNKNNTGTPNCKRTPLIDVNATTPILKSRLNTADISLCTPKYPAILISASSTSTNENVCHSVDEEITFKSFVSAREKRILSTTNTPNRHHMASPDVELKPLHRHLRPM